MKIVFIKQGLGAGGAEKVLTMLANDWSSSGHDISIIAYTDKESFFHLNSSINLIRISLKLEKKTTIAKIKHVFDNIRVLKKILLAENADILISFITEMNLYSIIAAKLARKQIIVSEHTNFNTDSQNWVGFFRRYIYPFADALIVLTEYDKKKYNFIDNVKVIKNPLILTNEFSNIEREEIILGVGRLVELKGFDLLIRAFAKVKENNWKLVIVGEGPEKEALEQLAIDLNVKERVDLPGLTDDIEKYYKSASIFVLSSRIEGFPGVLCEAMGYGCPSIAFDCITGPRDIVEHNKTGVLVEAENLEKLAKEIQNFIDKPLLRHSIGLNSKKIEAQLEVKTISKQWFELFSEIKQKNVGNEGDVP